MSQAQRQPDTQTAETIQQLRVEYERAGLSEEHAAADPFAQFARWFGEALTASPREPNAMTVATATRDGAPSARVVLLRSWDDAGFVFYTNYDGQKARELAENPVATLLFHWPDLERQVRIVGTVARTTREESERYFNSRPLMSRFASIASRQSSVIPNRAYLEERLRQLEVEYPEGDPPLPDYWGGFRVAPHTFEFWQGRPARLHDRLRYCLESDGGWRIERLSP